MADEIVIILKLVCLGKGFPKIQSKCCSLILLISWQDYKPKSLDFTPFKVFQYFLEHCRLILNHFCTCKVVFHVRLIGVNR